MNNETITNRQAILISSMLISQKCLNSGIQILQDEHFGGKFKLMFQAIKACHKDQIFPDSVSIYEKLGGKVSLSDLADLPIVGATEAGFSWYVGLHLQDYAKAQAVNLLGMAAKTISQSQDVIKDLTTVQAGIEDIKKLKPTSTVLTPHEIAENQIKFMIENGNEPRWFYGNAGLDSLTDGIYPGQFIILAARPGVGKTTLALNMAHWLCSSGMVGMFLSTEMSQWAITKILMKIINNRELGYDASIESLSQAKERLRGLNLTVEEATYCTPGMIAGKVRQSQRERGLNVVFVDYVQRLRGDGQFKGLYEQATKISGDLADLAHSSKVAIIALAQLNRSTEKDNRKPRMSDLRETGALEQDADQIMLLHTEDNKAYPYTMVNLDLSKNRTGKIGELSYGFHKPTSIFKELTS